MKSNYRKLTLSNGLVVIFQPMSSVESVAVYVAVGAGPRYETKETAGLAHFLEHMLFEGTRKFVTSKDLAQYLERVGGKSGAYTDKEYVSYYVKVPKNHLGIAFCYLSEIFFNSLLDEKAIEKEKGIVLEELRRSKDNPEVDIWDLWFEWMWGRDQSLGRSTLGDETTIQSVTKQKLEDYIDKFYHPSNMTIAVVGDFSFKKAEEYTRKYFDKKQNGNTPQFEKQIFIPKKMHAQVVRTNTHQNHLMLGFVTEVTYNHEDRFSLRLVADILSNGISSRLFHKLVYELGIAYFTGAHSWIFSDMGLFYIFGGFSSENILMAIKVILQELENLKKEKIPDVELREAKEKDKAGLHFSLETPDTIASFYSSQQITEKTIMNPEEISERIDEITTEDIQITAKKYFTPTNLCLSIKGPTGKTGKETEEAIEQLIKSQLSESSA